MLQIPDILLLCLPSQMQWCSRYPWLSTHFYSKQLTVHRLSFLALTSLAFLLLVSYPEVCLVGQKPVSESVFWCCDFYVLHCHQINKFKLRLDSCWNWLYLYYFRQFISFEMQQMFLGVYRIFVWFLASFKPWSASNI